MHVIPLNLEFNIIMFLLKNLVAVSDANVQI
jgi:hypothetical protein